MSNINKKLIFPIAALAVLTLAIFDVGIASANNSTDPRETLVQKIAEKFNLNQVDVQSVFDEVQSEHQKEMQTKAEERLNKLVTDGKITEEQKTLIQNKHEELRSEREANKDSFKDLTPEERRVQMESKKAELEAWASENGIDAAYLMQNAGERGYGGPGGPGGARTQGSE